MSPSGVIKEVHPKGIERSSYDHGSRAVFKCDGANGGYGYVTLKCMTDNTWSSRDRDCSDAVKFDNGSLIGIVGTSSCLLLMVFVVFFTKSRIEPTGELDSLDGRSAASDAEVVIQNESIA